MVDLVRLIENLELNGFSIFEDAFSETEFAEMQRLFNQLDDRGLFSAAGVGTLGVETEIRGDHTVWVDTEKTPIANTIFEIQNTLNESFFFGIKEFHGHFAKYPVNAYYRRHFDNPKGRDHRMVSLIWYLNADWSAEDGGELVLKLPSGDQRILPTRNKLVLFLSSKIEHEVLPSLRKQRLSFTGWFTRTKVL